MTAFSLAGQSSLLYNGGAEHWGVSLQDLLRFAGDAEALIGIGGLTSLPEILGSVKEKDLYRSGSRIHSSMECGLQRRLGPDACRYPLHLWVEYRFPGLSDSHLRETLA